ncbi:response regulator transcription factor [Staphylococcus ursi]|uniref:response regulator transcription factor n=1 Tax=Staphylococcus sp. MI 10-1553 TaxID=1912064 RepID=UPI001398626C|nr:response regulator transcription factor [Staphylococcus sp. MI 10-1553]QHW35980.1 response regulator transcription factor [Staphylococcus sp. MI 10-1553]
MQYEALIIEDDIDIAHILSLTLTKMNIKAHIVYSGLEAQACIEKNTYDLILLDLMLPEVTGEEILPIIKANTNSKIIVISAKVDIEEKVHLLHKGADDYITKPFDIKEVAARVAVQLRNLEHHKNPEVLVWKDLRLDLTKHQAYIKNIEMNLTNTEYDILTLLMSQPENAFSKQKIYEKVQGIYFGDDNTINVHISNIRKKISKHTNETYIKTVWGIGFMLI